MSRIIIDRFMKYAWNYKSVKIKNHQGVEFYIPEVISTLSMHIHLGEKWKALAEKHNGSRTLAFLMLWHELDKETQHDIAEWLEKNYQG